MCVNSRIITLVLILVNFSDKGATNMICNSTDGKEDAEHSCAGFVEVSKIFVDQDTFFLGTQPYARFYQMLLSAYNSTMTFPSLFRLYKYSTASGMDWSPLKGPPDDLMPLSTTLLMLLSSTPDSNLVKYS